MGRKKVWPPRINSVRGQDRVRINGRDHYLGKSGSPEAKAKYLQLIATCEQNGGVLVAAPSRDLSVEEAVARWLLNCETQYSDRGRESVQMRLAVRPLVALYGPTLASNFDDQSLEDLQKAMASGNWMDDALKAKLHKMKKPVGWCRRVVNRNISRIKTMWRWLERKKIVPKGSYSALLTVRGLPKNSPIVRHIPNRRAATREEVEAVMKKAVPAVAAMLDLQWWSGMRPSEVRIMRLCDIDRSGSVWLYRPPQHKNDWREDSPEKVVPLGPKCQAVLVSWIENVDEDDGYLFPPSRRRRNPHYTRDTYAQAVRKACLKAGVKTIPYACRHAAKRRIKKEAGLDAARAVLGHTSIETTNLYDEQIDLTLATDVMKKFG